MLITAPKIMHFMVYLGLPSARIMAVRAELKSRKGSPPDDDPGIIQRRLKSCVSVAPNSRTICRANRLPSPPPGKPLRPPAGSRYGWRSGPPPLLPAAQAEAHIRRAAVPDHQRQGNGDNGQRKGHVGGGHPRDPHPWPTKI